MKGLPPSAYAVYRELLAAQNRGEPCPTLNELADRTYFTVSSVNYGIDKLVTAGYVRRKAGKYRNLRIVREL